MLDSATESDPENSKKKPDKLIGGRFTADSDTESDADQGEFTILYPHPIPTLLVLDAPPLPLPSTWCPTYEFPILSLIHI